MKTYLSRLLALGLVSLISSTTLQAQENGKAEWNHEEAKNLVKRVEAIENSGQPWNIVKWETKADQAIEKAKTMNKPICVFMFVNKGGPETAPC